MKTLSLKFRALAFMLLSVTLSAFADTWTDPSTGISWTYTVLDDGTVALGGGTSSTPAVPASTTGELTVPAQLNGLDVTSVMAYGFYNCSKITSIEFEPSTITLQKDASSMFYGCRALADLQFVENWNTSNVTNMSSMFRGGTSTSHYMKITSLEPLRNWDTSKVTNMSNMFWYCKNVTSLEPLAHWNTSKVTNMSGLFSCCGNIVSLDPLRNWNTSRVTNLNSTFGGQQGYSYLKMESLEPIANWDVSNVSNMGSTFNQCRNITSLEALAHWNTSKVTNMSYTFSECIKITTLEPLQNWDTSNVTNMSSMFYRDSLLVSLQPLASWNTGKVTNMSSMFWTCKGIESLEPLRNWDTGKVTSMKQMFANDSKITSLEPLASWNVGNVKDMSYMFQYCGGIESLEPLRNWNTDNITNLTCTFQYCSKISSLEPLANWNVSNVTTLSSTFSFDPLIESLEPLRNWDISKVQFLSGTFSFCPSITSVEPLSNWNTGSVTNMDGLFRSTGISTLEPIGNWDTSKVTSMRYMFVNCHNLTYANELNNWDISSVRDMSEMFAFSGLIYINMSSWDVTGKTLNNMFAHDYNAGNMLFAESYYDTGTNSRLERVYLPKKGLANVASCMFNGCTALKEITLPSTVTAIDGQAFQNCKSLKEITIPSKVTTIRSRAFNGTSSLNEVYCMPTNPPAIENSNAFDNIRDRTLYVKTGALDAYKSANIWKSFGTVTDIIPVVIGADRNYSTLSFDFDADFSETEGVQPYIATKYLEGEEAADYLSGFEAKRRLAAGRQNATASDVKDIKLIVLARYPDGYVPSRTGDDNFDFHGVILYGQPGTYYFKMGEQDFASGSQKTVTWSNNYMKSAYESWLLNPTYDHAPVNWMEYPKSDTYNFVLKSNRFKYIDNAGTINRHKAWLELPAEKFSGTYFEAGAKMIALFDPDDCDSFATGLSFVVEDEPAETQSRYNLNGQKVDASYRGMVIMSGRKILNR